MPPGWEAWQLTDVLGEGAYGIVYRAHRQIGADTFESAIKVTRVPDSQHEAQAMARELGGTAAAQSYYRDIVHGCIQEIRVMNGLKGITNIVSVEDYELVADEEALSWTIFIRMELLTSFQEYQQSHAMTEDEVLRLGKDICMALSYCEKANIIHRDIKPSNIFVSSMGSFKLGDFGVARKLDQTTGLYSSKGTYPYMAPEILAGQPYDNRADIYSLGLVLYRLLNRNREPFLSLDKQMLYQRDREEAILRRIKGEAMPPPVDASPQLAEVILKACAHLPKDRYLSAVGFSQALAQAQQRSKRGTPARRRRRLWTLALTRVLLPGILALAIIRPGWLNRANSLSESLPTPQVTITPLPLVRLDLSDEAAGITFLGKEARHWVNPGKALADLSAAERPLDEAGRIALPHVNVATVCL